VRREAARYALCGDTAREPVTDWIIDDTGFPKQGTHSVGVQRQYSGTIGKDRHCQVAASLTIATRTEHVPVGLRAVPARSWTEEIPSARAEAAQSRRGDVQDQAELGVEMIERAIADGLPLAGAGRQRVCDNSEFRRRVRCEGLGYAVGLHRTDHGMWRLDLLGRRIR